MATTEALISHMVIIDHIITAIITTRTEQPILMVIITHMDITLLSQIIMERLRNSANLPRIIILTQRTLKLEIVNFIKTTNDSLSQ